MDKLIRSIPVRDANGAELTLHEYRRQVPGNTVDGMRYMRKIRHLMLDSGEAAEYVDENTFVLVSAGKKLSRIKAVG